MLAEAIPLSLSHRIPGDNIAVSSSPSIFPVRKAVEIETSPRVVGIETADEAVTTLSSATAREIFNHLYAHPATASDIAESTDTSIQNVQYHLGQMRDAGLIRVVDTWYSIKGAEMKVYAPAAEPLVIFAGTPDSRTDIRRALNELD